MTTHELLPYAVAIFTVTNIIGAALSIARVVSERKRKQRDQVTPFPYSSTGSQAFEFHYSAEEYSQQEAKPVRMKFVTVVLTGAAAAAAIASAIMAFTH